MEPERPALLSQRFTIHRSDGNVMRRELDAVAVEEPLQLSINYSVKEARFTRHLALTMRTPGHDAELTAGYLVSEGIIQSRADLVQVRLLGGGDGIRNEIVAELAPFVDVDEWRSNREAVLNSSCGICGKRSVEAALGLPEEQAEWQQGPFLSTEVIEQLPGKLRSGQEGFGRTGGLHAAGLFDLEGTLCAAFEDIGRHNALDKLVGHCFLSGQFPLSNSVLFLSSRSSFELVQKTVRAGATFLLTVGAPSSLAITTARTWGITLIGFVRDGRCNVYSGEWRIKSR